LTAGNGTGSPERAREYRNESKQADSTVIPLETATHARKGELLNSCAVILARAAGQTDRDEETLRQGFRLLFEGGAAFHLSRAERLRRGEHVRDYAAGRTGAQARNSVRDVRGRG
jgi:hypothetical protein